MARNTTISTKGRTTKARRAAGSTGAGTVRLSSGAAAAASMEFAVAVDPGVLETLSARPSSVKKLVDSFSKLMAGTQKSGQASGFTVMIDAKGDPKFEPLPRDVLPAAVSAEDDRLDAALEAAR